MTNRNFKILEYDKIIEQLVNCADTPLGKKNCKKLRPLKELADVQVAQGETSAALARIYRHGNLSFVGVNDIRIHLKRASIDAVLGTGELLDVAKLLGVAKHAIEYDKQDEVEDNLEDADCLKSYFNQLDPLTSLEREIRRCIISEEEISDEASSTLRSIRKNIKQTNEKIRTQMNQIVANQTNQSMLQDAIVTMRNNRYCIPLKSEYRSHFPGMIHDQSSTGSTLFIEPMAVVNLNNELTELFGKEQTEIEKILALLTEQVAFEQEILEDDFNVLSDLDFIFARGQFARQYDGTMPVYNEKGYINIKKGRHPLLDKKTVVPIDISLGDDYNLLIITGPNTGGKTVSLKTLGLFSLMGQSGLHIPAFEGSELTMFDRVYADIGDEQSIEQSLSTFSSHMTSIVKILKAATPHSLVLFDELGGGTDPTEGAALAISILSHLHERGVLTAATTHYSELKVFALSEEGVQNACCEFDVESLRPTYRLLIGIPGKSNAFAISKKLGLPDYIIDNAKNQIDATNTDFESLLSDLEHSRITIEKEQALVESYKKEIEQLKDRIAAKESGMAEKRTKILEDAREEARTILEEAKRNADFSIRKYQKWMDDPNKADTKHMEAERTKLRKHLDSLQSSKSKNLAPSKEMGKPVSAATIKEGDVVLVTTLGIEGTIQSKPNGKGDCYVLMGAMRSLVNIKNMTFIQSKEKAEKKQAKASRPANPKQFTVNDSVKAEINLLGKTTDEAIGELDKYLDDAYMAKLNQVTIIHGKGTGALRKAVQNYLKKQRNVKSYRPGMFGEGEAGVTIVEFK